MGQDPYGMRDWKGEGTRDLSRFYGLLLGIGILVSMIVLGKGNSGLYDSIWRNMRRGRQEGRRAGGQRELASEAGQCF